MVGVTVSGVFRVHLLVVGALLAAHVAAKALLLIGGHGHLMGFARVLDLDREESVANFLSGLALFACAAAAALLARAEPEARAARGWGIVAACLAFMALDEGAGLHDRLTGPLQAALGTGGVLYLAWVIPYAALAAGVSALVLPLLRSLPRATLLRLVAAGALYVGSAIGMEMVAGSVLSAMSGGAPVADLDWREVGRDPRVIAAATLEEVGEMVAVALALRALLLHLVGHLGADAVRLSVGGRRRRGAPAARAVRTADAAEAGPRALGVAAE